MFRVVAGFIGLIILVVSFVQLAAADDGEIKITSVIDGRYPYMVVIGTDGKRKPGIYIPTQDGSWKLIYEGAVLKEGASVGVIEQLEMARETKGYEALAVVDGKLIAIQSNPRAINDVIVLGEGNESIIDPLTFETVRMPAIQSLDDVSVLAHGEIEEGQLILVSVSKGEGRGVTFAFYLKSVIQDDKAEIKLLSPPTLIDFQFRRAAHLKRFVRLEKSVFSPRILKQFQERFKSTELGLGHWMAELSLAQGILNSRSSGSLEDMQLPYFDLETNRISVAGKISIPISGGEFSIFQEFDPIEGSKIVRCHPPGAVIPGGVDFKKASRSGEAIPKIFQVHYAKQFDGRESGSLILVEGSLYLINSSNNKTEAYRLPLPVKGSIENASAFVTNAQDEKGAGVRLLLVSLKTSEGNSTHAIQFLDQNGTLVQNRNLQINKFFEELAILNARLRVEKSSNSPAFLYDDKTECEGDYGTYMSKARKTIRFLDITQTKSMKQPVRRFIEPVESTKISDLIRYRVFDDKEERTSTGVYFSEDSNGYRVGELLKAQLGSEERALLANKKFTVGDGAGLKIGIEVIAYDPSFTHGKNSFTLMVVGYSLEDPALKFVHEFEFARPFSELNAADVFQGLKRFSDQLNFVFAFSGNEKAGRGPEVFSVHANLVLSGSEKNQPHLQPKKNSTLAQELVTGGEFPSRMLYSESGAMFWLATPKLGRDDRSYKLIDIANAREVFPGPENSSNGRYLSYGEFMTERGVDISSQYGFSDKDSWKTYQYALKESLKRKGYETSEPLADPYKERFKGFRRLLDHFADPESAPEKQVVIVAPQDKAALISLLVEKSQDTKGWGLSYMNDRFFLYAFDPESATQKDIFGNLEDLKRRNKSGRAVVFADAADLEKVFVPTDGPDFEGFRLEQGEGRVPSALYLLANEGERRDLSHDPIVNREVPVLIVATPQEWGTLRVSTEGLRQEICLTEYTENYAFYGSSWRVWGPGTKGINADIRRLKDVPVSDAEERIVPNVFSAVRDMASPDSSPTHRILIVPAKLKTFIRETLLARWASTQNLRSDEVWTHRNSDLRLEELSLVVANDEDGKVGEITQETMLLYLQSLRLAKGRKSVLLGDLAQIARHEQLSGEQRLFQIGDPAEGASAEMRVPHTLYLLATEGRKLSPAEFESNSEANGYSTLLIGTEAEWEAIKKGSEFEDRFGLHDHFELVHVEEPTRETKVELLDSILNTPAIRMLGYSFSLEDGGEFQTLEESPRSPRYRLLEYLVSRTEGLASRKEIEPTSAFLDVLREFRNAVVSDPQLRRSKVLGRNFVEQLLSKVFDLPLNLAILPADDPLVRMRDVNRAALELMQLGYDGPLDLKKRILNLLLAQTRSNPGRKIPSSAIFYGETSTGKTYLYEVLEKFLGLKRYVVGGNDNENAQSFFIDFKAVGTTEAEDSASMISADEVIRELCNFLTRPKGYRGYILLDDVHKAAPEDFAKIYKFISSLQDASEGFVTLKDSAGNAHRIPVKNISIIMTVNPVETKIKELAPNGNVKEQIIATLTSKHLQLEGSMFTRWGDVINFEEFPVGAKSPKLASSLREAANHEFNSKGLFTIASRDAIETVVSQFQDSNARDFLASSVSLMMDTPQEHVGSEDRVFVVAPKRDLSSGYGKRSYDSVEAFVEGELVAIPVGKRHFDGQIEMTRIAMDSFRTMFYLSLIRAASADYRMAFDETAQQTVLAPFLTAIVENMEQKGEIPLRELGLEAKHFGADTAVRREEFSGLMRYYQGSEYFFSSAFREAEQKGAGSSLLDSFVGLKRGGSQKSGVDVAVEFVREATPLMQRYLAAMARVSDVGSIPGAVEWINQIENETVKEELKAVAAETVGLFARFIERIDSVDLADRSPTRASQKGLRTIEMSQLFMTVLDRSMTKLPWGKINHLLVDALGNATRYMDIGQMPGLQDYLFLSRFSLLRSIPHEVLDQTASASESYRRLMKVRRELRPEPVPVHRSSEAEREALSGGGGRCGGIFGGA